MIFCDVFLANGDSGSGAGMTKEIQAPKNPLPFPEGGLRN